MFQAKSWKLCKSKMHGKENTIKLLTDFVKMTAVNANQGLDQINLCADVLVSKKTMFWVWFGLFCFLF